MAELAPERVTAADGAAYVDRPATVADAAAGITGYCMGARVGLCIAAAHAAHVPAVAGFHGGGLVMADTPPYDKGACERHRPPAPSATVVERMFDTVAA